MGIIYLLHFDRRLSGRAGHYAGYMDALGRRLEAHRRGRGSALMAACRAAGVGWALVRLWPGDRALERRLKRRRQLARLCPVCRPAALARHAAEERRRRRAAATLACS